MPADPLGRLRGTCAPQIALRIPTEAAEIRQKQRREAWELDGEHGCDLLRNIFICVVSHRLDEQLLH